MLRICLCQTNVPFSYFSGHPIDSDSNLKLLYLTISLKSLKYSFDVYEDFISLGR